ncbi:recombinase family protein [Thomasclavelia cocleata]|uniref:recombinase family protein n=1 Tax=Thomasclavelia cocleata TaxID=69824 RepID=UPI0025ABE0D0|nr:recombinase family protein [Thomasclavelia cocleata]
MNKERIKVYTYKRVSTAMQIDGYSLDAQRSRMKAYADFNDYEIVGEYEDAGKSGKSIEGRMQFRQMMEDVKSGKDNISYVLVFKLSRFGRNAADVLSTLQVMQDFGVNLICVEDGIDSSKDAGKLMISVLSAVAEIERENIRVQTMEGRIQKAREGKWNGGFAPYGYQLVNGKLEINEEEAVAIRTIYDQYVNTDIGSNGISKYLENHGIRKIQRQNGKNPLFDAHLVRLILKNPVYCGKIAYGRRKTEKVHGTRNEYHLVEQENFLLVDGLHEAIIPEDVWNAAQAKLIAQAKKYEHVNKGKNERTHLLSGIVKCPICGAGMYGNKSIKYKKDGTKYKDFFYYGCKHRGMQRGHKCDYRKQIREELLDDAVAEVIVKLVSNPHFAAMMQEKINMKVDTTAIDQEITNYEKQLRQDYAIKSKLIEEIDNLNPDDRHYIRRKADLDDRLYRMYDKIEELESQLMDARAKKTSIEAEKITGDNIYKVLIYFDKLYFAMNDVERRQLIEALIAEIQIYEERKPNGQWLKSIRFKLPIIESDLSIGLDNGEHVETVVMLSHKKPDSVINVKVEFGEGEGKVPLDNIAKRAEAYKPKEWVTYKMIKEYIEAKYGFKVHTAYIAEVKRELGLPMYDAPNAVEELKQPRKHPTAEKVEAIRDALKHFEVIRSC